MTEITRGVAPPERERSDPTHAARILALAEAAAAEPGVWFSIDRPEGMNPTSVSTTIYRCIAQQVSEYSVAGGRVSIRFDK